MQLATQYELPATENEQRTTNTCLAAALSAVGVGGRAQITSHQGTGNSLSDRRFFTYHLHSRSATFPALVTHELIEKVLCQKIDRDAPMWPSREIELFMSAWFAVESRREFFNASKNNCIPYLQQIKTGPGICALDSPHRKGGMDLRALAAGGHLPTRRINGLRSIFALIVVGFVPVRFYDTSVLVTEMSLSPQFKDLTLEMCKNAYLEIDAYNRKVAEGGLVPPAPLCALPGYAPGYHPYQYAVQSLFNYNQLLGNIKSRTRDTLFFKSDTNPRTAIVDVDASDESIEDAISHVVRK